jgi:hypothetical protein
MTAEEFFQQLNNLILTSPNIPSRQANSENCELANQVYYCRNMQYCFDCVKCNDGIYMYDCFTSVNCIDCDYTFESELCYDCVDAAKCFNSNFLDDCNNLTDCQYCTRCKNSHDLFGCVNLVNKSFCIFNRQLSESEYKQKLAIYNSWPKERVLAEVEKIKSTLPVTQTHENNNENSSYGNFVYFCKNCYMCFDANTSKDSGYLYDTGHQVNSYDATFSTDNELTYESVDSGKCFNCNYIIFSGNCQDSSYVINSSSIKNCLGVANRKHAQYEILNREYSKEEYEVLSKEILDDIKRKNLGWGDIRFF